MGGKAQMIGRAREILVENCLVVDFMVRKASKDIHSNTGRRWYTKLSVFALLVREWLSCPVMKTQLVSLLQRFIRRL